MSKFKKGLWYQCNHSLSFWRKGYYYCQEDNLLKGNDNKPHRVAGFHHKHFTDGEVIKISAPK